MKILVIRLSSIGDIILTTPVFRILKKAGHEVHFLTKSSYKNVLEGNSNIDHTHIYEDAIEGLRQEQFDHVLDLQRNGKSGKVLGKLGRPSTRLFKQNITKWLMVNLGVKKDAVSHITTRYIQTLQSLGLEDDGFGLDYTILNKSHQATADLPPSFIAFSIGATYMGKKMGAKRIAQIIDGLNLPVVLLGGDVDKVVAQEIVGLVANNQVVNKVGQLSLNGSGAVIAKSRLVIAFDTGLMHMSAALQVPIVSIWGCTTPSLGMSPFRAHSESIMIEPDHISNRPCSKLGNRCKNHPRCIEQVDVSEVTASCNHLIQQ